MAGLLEAVQVLPTSPLFDVPSTPPSEDAREPQVTVRPEKSQVRPPADALGNSLP
jgi:hypothetical protein